VSIDQQRVSDVPRDDRQVVNIHLGDIINDVNASATRRVRWLDDPEVSLGVLLFELLEVLVKVTELVWDDVSVGQEVEGLFAELVLHAVDVRRQFVFAGQLEALGEVVNFLVFV
jgi:hypothetical protein